MLLLLDGEDQVSTNHVWYLLALLLTNDRVTVRDAFVDFNVYLHFLGD